LPRTQRSPVKTSSQIRAIGNRSGGGLRLVEAHATPKKVLTPTQARRCLQRDSAGSTGSTGVRNVMLVTRAAPAPANNAARSVPLRNTLAVLHNTAQGLTCAISFYVEQSCNA
jgi:hypothetical protein